MCVFFHNFVIFYLGSFTINRDRMGGGECLYISVNVCDACVVHDDTV